MARDTPQRAGPLVDYVGLSNAAAGRTLQRQSHQAKRRVGDDGGDVSSDGRQCRAGSGILGRLASQCSADVTIRSNSQTTAVQTVRPTLAVLVLAVLVLAACGAGRAESAECATDRDLADRGGQSTVGSDRASSSVTTPGEDYDEGRMGVLVNAKSDFDRWTAGRHWAWINQAYDSMVVWEPYWDSRLDDFDRVFVSRNAYAIKVETTHDPRSVEHPEWILRDADGDPVYIPFDCDDGCPQYAADVGNPEFRRALLDEIATLVRRGYPGLMLDDVNLDWRFSDERGDDITPIDPRTGAPLTLESWQRYMAEFVEMIRSEFPDLNIMHNAIWYTEPPESDNPYVMRQIAAADYVMLERGATDPGLVEGTSKFGMRTFLDYIDRVHSLGANVLLLDETATTIEEQWFNVAAGLLTSNGQDLVSTEDWDLVSPDCFWSGFTTNLGDALGPRYDHENLIRRDFTEGIVLLNEPGRDPVTIQLDAPMLTPSGRRVTSITLGDREAIVLRHPDTTSAPSLDAPRAGQDRSRR